MRSLVVLVAVLAAASALLVPARAAEATSSPYRAWTTCGSGPASTCYEGDQPYAVFRDVRHSSTTYRVCVTYPGATYTRCKTRRTTSRGSESRVHLPSTGIGQYSVRWTVHGRLIATRRMFLASEGV
jgi:hypothetical protein